MPERAEMAWPFFVRMLAVAVLLKTGIDGITRREITLVDRAWGAREQRVIRGASAFRWGIGLIVLAVLIATMNYWWPATH